MEDNRRTPHHWARWAIIVVVLVCAVYPLSQGPTAMMVVAAGKPQSLVRAGTVLYWPLRYLPQPFRGYLARWEQAWIKMSPKR
ncbi:MAG: hypothetical protein KGL39_52655 [Patescibacteria group bacterium]|nr:hypothetical protein [Patescibacteria group bacterium]